MKVNLDIEVDEDKIYYVFNKHGIKGNNKNLNIVIDSIKDNLQHFADDYVDIDAINEIIYANQNDLTMGYTKGSIVIKENSNSLMKNVYILLESPKVNEAVCAINPNTMATYDEFKYDYIYLDKYRRVTNKEEERLMKLLNNNQPYYKYFIIEMNEIFEAYKIPMNDYLFGFRDALSKYREEE